MDIKATEIALLNEYKKYDYLNADKNHPLIKIFVSYIKPSFLFKSEILTPIHLGRAVAKENSKDGVISDEDLKWLYENCIGDDDFEGNISNLNRRVGFLTGTYWAWKNYEKLGNPEYFGSFGYRRLFAPYFLNDIKEYDLIIPQLAGNVYTSNKERLICAHGTNSYDITFSIIKKLSPEDINLFDEYMEQNLGYYFELYILKKNLFYNFCEWIYPILDELIKNTSKLTINSQEKNKIIDYFVQTGQENLCQYENFEIYQKRIIGFILERVTGYYLYKISKQYKSKEVKLFQLEDKKTNLFNALRKRIRSNKDNNA